MASKEDTVLRQIALLRLIPREPFGKSTTTLLSLLQEQGFDISIRMLQRDLEKLSSAFPIICEDSKKPYRWSFEKSFQSGLPVLDAASALIWILAEDHLKYLLPAMAIEKLSPTFQQAKNFLDVQPNNQYGNWREKIKALPMGKALIPAIVKEHIWHWITEAVLLNKIIIVDYLSRKSGELESRRLHPLGIVHRNTTTYLVAHGGNNQKDGIRQFAVHRIKNIKTTEEPAKTIKGFSIENYVQSGAFDMPVDDQKITLKALIDSKVAWHLEEMKLSEDQTISEAKNGLKLLTATIPNDEQTQWWLMGFGSKVEVLEPHEWRKAIYDHAKKIIEKGL